MNNLFEYIKSDLIQAKIIEKNENLSLFKFLKFFFKSRYCRIHFFVRLRISGSRIWSIIAKIYLDSFLIEIGENCIIGKYFTMPHPRCIIISNGVKIGEHVHVGQYATIGGNLKKIRTLEDGSIQKLPIIGNNVLIHAGAVIGGPVIVGNEVVIGANSTITKDVPSNTIAFSHNKYALSKINVPDEGGEMHKNLKKAEV